MQTDELNYLDVVEEIDFIISTYEFEEDDNMTQSAIDLKTNAQELRILFCYDFLPADKINERLSSILRTKICLRPEQLEQIKTKFYP